MVSPGFWFFVFVVVLARSEARSMRTPVLVRLLVRTMPVLVRSRVRSVPVTVRVVVRSRGVNVRTGSPLTNGMRLGMKLRPRSKNWRGGGRGRNNGANTSNTEGGAS
jgi:hypothetical protein